MRVYTENGRFAFLSPLGGVGQRTMFIRLIGKLVVDFLLVIIELLFARCYGWGATSEYRLKMGVFTPMGSLWPKISGRGSPYQPFFLFPKLGSIVWYKNVGTTFFRFVTNHTFDRRTDGQTDRKTDSFLVAG